MLDSRGWDGDGFADPVINRNLHLSFSDNGVPINNEGITAPESPLSMLSKLFSRWTNSRSGWLQKLILVVCFSFTLQKLNLKFNAWTMSKVSVSQRAIILSESKKLTFWPEDVHKVFGIPCGHRSIRGRDGHITPDAIQFIKKTLGMDKKGVHSLRAAEEFLLRDVSETSSKLEKDCFQIAFVIFVMGHVLAPTTKHDYATIDFWWSLANT